MNDTFLKDAVTDRLQDDVPEVVAAALKVVEVSGAGWRAPPAGRLVVLLTVFRLSLLSKGLKNTTVSFDDEMSLLRFQITTES